MGAIGGGLVTIHASFLINTGSLYGAVSLLSSIMALAVATVYGYYAYLLGVFSYQTNQQAERFRLGEETDSLLYLLAILSIVCRRIIKTLETKSPDTCKTTISDYDRATIEKHVYTIRSAIISARVERGSKIRPLFLTDRMIKDLQRDTLNVLDIQSVQKSAINIARHIADTRRRAKSRA